MRYHPRYTLIWCKLGLNANDSLNEMFQQGTEKWEAHWPSRVANLTGMYKFVGKSGRWRSHPVELMYCKQRLSEINRLNPRRGNSVTLWSTNTSHTFLSTHTHTHTHTSSPLVNTKPNTKWACHPLQTNGSMLGSTDKILTEGSI